MGGGSNSIGLFHPFIEDTSVRLIGIEAAGGGIGSGHHSVRLDEAAKTRPGVLEGCYSYLLQDQEGQV